MHFSIFHPICIIFGSGEFWDLETSFITTYIYINLYQCQNCANVEALLGVKAGPLSSLHEPTLHKLSNHELKYS